MERNPEQQPEHSATDAHERSMAGDAYVTISDAARMTGASRTRLYRYVESGKLERTNDGRVSVQALLNAGFDLKEQRPAAAAPSDNLSYLLMQYTDMARQLNESLEDQIEALHEQLRFTQEQLRLSQQREAQLWQMLQRGQAEPAAPEPRASDAVQGGSQDAAADMPHVTPRVPFADEQAAAAMPAGEPQQGPEAQPPNTQQSSFFGRWRSRPGEPADSA
jgi:hypothetical protein